MPYTADKPGAAPRPEILRDRIPGWGADLDPADRPAFPREQPGIVTGAHWQDAERQTEIRPRERSVEHERLTAVFGTAQPLRGAAGRIRRFAYERYSEAQSAHWLVLMLGDRVDAVAAHAASLMSGRPDEPLTQSGVLGERGPRPLSSRRQPGRVDMKHAWLDPIIVAGPWALTGVVLAVAGVSGVRRLSGGRRRASQPSGRLRRSQ
jgi:hypothetical protein